jgi:di/tricarboxylate transporter
VFLATGGIALGNGVESSGLMDTMDGLVQRMFEGLALYTVVLVLSVVVLVRFALSPPSLFLLAVTLIHDGRLFRHLSATR